MATADVEVTTRSPSHLKAKTSRVSLSTRSPTRPPSPSKKDATPSPRLHVRPKKVPLTYRDIVVNVKRIIGSSAKSHRELDGAIGVNGSTIVYSAGATIVQCNFSSNQDPAYRYYCAPPDQDSTNELVNGIAGLSLKTATPPHSRARTFPTQTPRSRASMGFDVHRAPNSSPHNSSPGNSVRNRSKGAKDRIRLLGCVAISSDQCWVAAGEKGYTPRVLVYSNSMNAITKQPHKAHALLEHSDGIRCMAFSPCSNFLVSVGTVHDQCIIVYKLTPKNGWVKVAAAKFKDIIDAVVWSKRRIITVGRRHLRVWEWHENSSAGDVFVLSNRSVLYSQLGDDAEFFAAAAMEGDSIVIASRSGFMYHVDAGTREIRSIIDIGREISCLSWDKAKGLIWIGGESGCLGAIPSNFEGEVRYRGIYTEIFSEIIAISAGTILTVIDATGTIHGLSNLELQDDEPEHSPTFRQVNGAIKGLRLIRGPNALSALFFTWTGHRVCFLDDEQCIKTVDLEDTGTESPEIECAAFCPERKLLVIGDNYRTLRVIDIEHETEIWAEEMESDYDYDLDENYDAAILDLDVQSIGGKTYIISAWRDHSVLVHCGSDSWRLATALNSHRLGVNYARFYDRQKFITSSLDRTVIISQLDDTGDGCAIQTIRTINLARAHAIDIELASESTLVLSTSDRQILVYDIISGDLLHTYKTTVDSSELVTLSGIGLSKPFTFPPLMKTRTLGSPVPQGQIRLRSLLAGAGNDKSIRIYDQEAGIQVVTKWSHAESITSLIWLPTATEDSKTRQLFVSAGADGCVVIWELAIPSRQQPPPPRFSPRTISQRFRRSMDDILKRD